MKKRLICALLSILMLVSLLPVGALAADEGGSTSGESAAAEENTEANEGISLAADETDSYVATVTKSSNTESYTTIEAAVSAANSKENATITLLSDVNAEGDLYFGLVKKLDLAGHTLSCGAITIGIVEDYGSGSLTIKECTGTIRCSGISVAEGSSLTVSSDVTILSTGTSLFSGSGEVTALTTGTFSHDVQGYCATGYTTQAVTSDGTTLYKVVKDEKVAEIDGTTYSTLTEALSAASDGETVTVIKAVTDEAVSYSNSASVTLDLAGYAVNLTSLSVTAGTLTITDSGSATSASSLGNVSADDGTLQIIGGTYSSDPSTYVAYGYAVSGDETNGYVVSRTSATLAFNVSNSDYITLSEITVKITHDGATTTTVVNPTTQGTLPYTVSGLYVGDSLEISATATVTDSGYTFTGWQNNGAYIQTTETLSEYKFTLEGDTTIKAVIGANGTLREECNAWLGNDYENTATYTITSLSDWYKFAYAVNVLGYTFEGKTVNLTADLDFSGTSSDFSYAIPTVGTTTTNFKGTFDGQNHTISNINYDSTHTATYAGVFGVTSGATIQNLNVKESSFITHAGQGSYAGAIAASAEDGTQIISCSATNVTVVAWFAGGIAGHSYSGTFTTVSASGIAFTDDSGYSSSKSGCIVGYAEALTVNGATVTSSLTSDSSSGMPAAVVGQANGDETLSNLIINAPGLNVIGTMETSTSYTVKIGGESTSITAAALTGNLNDSATLAVSAGTYSVDVNEYVVAGSAAVANTDSDTYTVTTGVAAVYVDGTCTGTYSTLAAAIDAASSGNTVKLLSNVTLTETVNIYKSITLDLGDYTITSTATGKAIYTTQTLTITANENGGIASSTGYAVLNQKGSGTGTLSLSGGTYTSSADHAIYNLAGTVTIESGTILTTGSEKAGIYNTSGGTVTVNGGSVSGKKYGIYSSGAVEITDGTITGTDESSSFGVYLASGATATISGGTIEGYEGLRQAGETEENETNETVDIIITGGTFEGVTHAVNVCTTATVSGGTFTATGTKDQYAVALYSNGAAISVSGGTFSAMYSTAWVNSGSSGTITVADGYEVNTGTLMDSNSSDSDPLVRTVTPKATTLGISDDSGIVIAKNIIDQGGATMYAQVSGENIGSYSTDKYPTTSLTMDNSTTGYVFAGWYTLVEGTYTACSESMWDATATSSDEYYYAKFVDANVLTVATQITSGTTASSATTNMRFLSSVDELDFSGVGFYITINGKIATVSTKTVYESISAASDIFTPSSVFSSASNYFIAYTLKNIPSSVFESEITVTAYWVTTDGTTVNGEANTFTINEMYG